MILIFSAFDNLADLFLSEFSLLSYSGILPWPQFKQMAALQ
jgi:hypothetical protein